MDIDLGEGCGLIVVVFYALTKPWGWSIIGALLATGGFIYGVTSHQVLYQSINHASLTPYFVKDGSDYFQEKNSSIYYILHENDLSPVFKREDFFNNGGFTLIARTDAENVDVTFSDDTHLTGSGYRIEEITFFDNNGQAQQVFSTSEYSKNPRGFYDDRWVLGRILIYIGAPLLIIGFLITLINSRVA